MYNAYGSTDKFNDFDDQRHQIGPFVFHNLCAGWQLFAGALFGATEGTPDTNLRVWLIQAW